MTIHVFTSAAANYLPKVRLLFESLRRHRPEWRLHLALADAPPADPDAAGGDELHRIEDLGIPEWRAWTFCHSLIELATGIKPFALKRLLARPDSEAVIYLDPDVVVFSPLEALVEAFAQADILITPHLTAPETSFQGIVANEICTAQHGVYNLGFIGVAARPEGIAFADWWADRVYRFCREDIPNGLYTDQRWIDFVPAFFERVRVLRSPALNVATWNLTNRRLAGSLDTGFTVNGEPLGFYHFSGVDFGEPPDQPAAAELTAWHRPRAAPDSAAPWAFAAFRDGTPILAEQRLVYRLRADLQRAYPDPFASAPASYQAWWGAQAAEEFPDLFDATRKSAEIARLASALVTGYAEL